jgi:hypothetical protein
LIHSSVALLAAALAPAAVCAALGGSLGLLTIGFVVALAHAVLLGVPAYLLMRMRGSVNALSAAIAGFVIGIVPVGLLGLGESGTQWIAYLQGVLPFGGFGLLGGLAFWATLRITSQAPGLRAASLIVVPLLAAAALALPLIAKDRSCHNLLRDGRSTISAQLRAEVHVEHSEWPAIVELVRAFAASHGLSFRDSSKDAPDVVRTLYLSACDHGVNIEISEQRWAHNGYKHVLGDRGVAIGVYPQRSDTDWQRLARPLVETLESRWPGKIRFRGDRGELIAKPPL